MPLEQTPRILPDDARGFNLNAVAGSDQRLSVVGQDNCQHMAPILGNDCARRSGIETVATNQFPVEKRRSGHLQSAGHNRNIDKSGPVYVREQEILGDTRKSSRNGSVPHHWVVHTVSTNKYLPVERISPVAKGEFVPYNWSAHAKCVAS